MQHTQILNGYYFYENQVLLVLNVQQLPMYLQDVIYIKEKPLINYT